MLSHLQVNGHYYEAKNRYVEPPTFCGLIEIAENIKACAITLIELSKRTDTLIQGSPEIL